MFCGNIFTSTDLQNHKKNHMKKSQERFHRVNRALFLSLSNAFEEQKFIPKMSPKIFWSAPCFPKIVCGGQCAINFNQDIELSSITDVFLLKLSIYTGKLL